MSVADVLIFPLISKTYVCFVLMWLFSLISFCFLLRNLILATAKYHTPMKTYYEEGESSLESPGTITIECGTSAVATEDNLKYRLELVSVSAGNAHTCGITTDKKAYCWGHGNSGQLGNGGNYNPLVPVAVSAPQGGGLLTFNSISAGGDHTCGIVEGGQAYCWGNGDSGELGNGGTVDSLVPVAVD